VYHVKTFCCFTGHEDEVYTKLKEVKYLSVFKKEDMDPSFHYNNSRRIMPIIISTVEGYRLCKNGLVCAEDLGNKFLHEFQFYFLH